jgi:hypothetical protein
MEARVKATGFALLAVCLLVPVCSEAFQYQVKLDGTGIEDDPVARLVLRDNYPNPFNPKTNIAFELPRPARVTLRVYDIAGRLVRTILDDVQTEAGSHAEVWDGRSDRGDRLASGVYLSRLEVDGEALSRTMVLLK